MVRKDKASPRRELSAFILAGALAIEGGTYGISQRDRQHRFKHDDGSVVHLGNISTTRPWCGRGSNARSGPAAGGSIPR